MIQADVQDRYVDYTTFMVFLKESIEGSGEDATAHTILDYMSKYGADIVDIYDRWCEIQREQRTIEYDDQG